MTLKSLKTLAKQAEPIQLALTVTERLPYYIQAPCELHCEVLVQPGRNYYVLNLKSKGQVLIQCQSCLKDFTYDFNHTSELALCHNEEIANQMMNSMDCIVQTGDELDVLEIATDDLHLFCPEKHEQGC